MGEGWGVVGPTAQGVPTKHDLKVVFIFLYNLLNLFVNLIFEVKLLG